jgi:lipopolysaccharide biosynthesis glycosyltransferase
MPNGGLQVVNPSKEIYNLIVSKMESQDVSAYDFADQSLLSDAFSGRWVALPYVYNALKTMRWAGVHDTIWKDDQIKNIHYLLSPKPWDAADDANPDESHQWWKRMNVERKKEESEKGITDHF